MTDMNHLGETAREVRKARGVSQKIAAKQLGVSAVYLCNVEKGKAMPSYAFLQTFEEWSGVDLYVVAWCKKQQINQLPNSLKDVAKQLTDIWQKSFTADYDDGKDVTDNATFTKSGTPR